MRVSRFLMTSVSAQTGSARRITLSLALLVTSAFALLPTATAGAATPQGDAASVGVSVNTLVGSGSWVSALGAASTCSNIGATSIACTHQATSLSSGLETCAGVTTVLPGVTLSITCHASLTGNTSGVGRTVTESGYAAACATFGITSGTLTFSDSLHRSYPSVPVTIINIAGNAEFFGQANDVGGVTVASAHGFFSLACGSPVSGINGSFSGTYSLA